RLGWEVHQANTGPEARRLARALRPQIVILDTELREESGWLTCAKLTLEDPTFKVILVSDEVTTEQQIYAETAGAVALVGREDGLPGLVGEVHETILPATK